MEQLQHTPDSIISRADFRKLIGISRSTEWRLLQKNKLPPHVEVNGRVLGYLASRYDEWLKENTSI